MKLEWQQVQEITQLDCKEDVYNISVEDNPNYFANRVLVHNCFANAFRASLYTAFFDNAKTMGLRHCNPDYYIKELDKMNDSRSKSLDEKSKLIGVAKAYALEIPVRFGIRFEDFVRQEKRLGISLKLLQYFKEISYPVMINTKSHIVGMDDYVKALSENKAGSAVHVTVITSNNNILKQLEPGAPSYDNRLQAIKNMTSAGIRVVARIEPYLFLITDEKEYVEKYIEDMKDAGVHNITFDTYSYTAHNPGITQSFINEGYDFDRLFLCGCDSQGLGSLLLGSFMQLFRDAGFSCSTFDMGNAPDNDQDICCEVSDWFKGGFNYGSTVYAARYIQSKQGKKVSWIDFKNWVNEKGGFLDPKLKDEVHHLWNVEGNVAYSHKWAKGIIPVDWDDYGIVYMYDSNNDYRQDILKGASS